MPTAPGARVLYISHNGLTEPLGRRQVLPYLVGLSGLGWRVSVISFEKADTASAQALATVEGIVHGAGIRWKPLRYHNRPPIVATVYDILRGCWYARCLSRDVGLIHARSAVPAFMAGLVSKRPGLPWIYDLRGLLAEEYVDAGHWPRSGVRHRVTSAVENRLLRSADGLVLLTHRIRDRLAEEGSLSSDRPTTVIPCSVDLGVFRPSHEWRRAVRSDLGWGDEPALVYSGSLGSWYRLQEMLDFFEAAGREMSGLRFLLLTPHVTLAEQEVRSRQLAGRVVARSVTPDAVPRHLAAGDAGICFLGRHASKDASSPTKYGEYLAAGLPVVTNSWIGDAQALAVEPEWLVVESFVPEAYRETASRLARLLQRPEATQLAARELARREFSLETAVDRYHDLYLSILSRRARGDV